MPILLFAALAVALVVLLLLPGSTPRLDRRRYPHGLALLERVPLGGTRQWLLVRTEDVTKPVVLFVHGGPGTSQLTLVRRNTRALEKHCTVVNWDQRGAGKSFAAGADVAGMRIGRFVDDLIELSEQLAGRFRQEKILLVGHSWGSVISMLAVARRPDLYRAYVGIGQMSRMVESESLSYAWTVARAQEASDRSALEKLTRMGPPPYGGRDWQSKFMRQRQILGKYGGEYHGSRIGAFGVVLGNIVLSREYTMMDRINVFRGIFRSVRLLLPELMATDLFVEVPEVEIPVYFCLGRHDWEVPSVLSAKYFDALRAPRKRLVWFESSAHMPNTEQKESFNRFLIETVLPETRVPVTV